MILDILGGMDIFLCRYNFTKQTWRQKITNQRSQINITHTLFREIVTT